MPPVLFSVCAHAHNVPPRVASAACCTHVLQTTANRQLSGDDLADLSPGYETGGLLSTPQTTVVVAAKTARRIQNPITVQFFENPIQWVAGGR